MNRMHDIPAERQIEILTARLERSERALRDAETALEKRMTELFRANQDLSLRETELARRLEVESALLLGALSTIQMATLYGERERGFSFSASAASLFGLPPGEEMTIDKVAAVLHPLDHRRIMRETSAFFGELEPGTTREYEHRIVRPVDGETRWLSWSIARKKGDDARPGYLLATVRDITEERANERSVRALQLRAERRVRELAKLQAELAAAKGTVEETLGARNRFISEMAHAIRTPLLALSGGLELLETEVREEGVKDLAVARDAAEQLGEVASRLIEEAAAEGNDLSAPFGSKTPPPVPQSPAGIPAQPHVLVAEDTESNRYVIERLLHDLGCTVVLVENGAAAVEAVRREHFDLVVMDVMMPIMNGEQATQTIRGLTGPAARTPIIGVTAHSLQSERERLLSSGMTACLAKPVRKEALETAIRTALISGRDVRKNQARFDHDLFRRTFGDLPAAYRGRMRDAAKKDITKYAGEVLAAVDSGDEEAFSRAAHSLTGVSLNIGATGIVEELALYREGRPGDEASIEPFREAVAACLLEIDDLYDALVPYDQ